ncbi:MAG: hypothetical protein K6E20_07105 [Acholeplasmatales bacterium]|nr:hypothetical protein [Acholeplasmatales bacterium]
MSLLYYFKAILNPKNWILIIGILFNILIDILILSGFIYLIWPNQFFTFLLIVVAFYIILSLLLETFVGDVLILNQNSLERLIKDKDNKKYYDILDNAIKASGKKYKNIDLALMKTEDINCYAIGMSTIVVTEGLLKLNKDSIEAMILKELINIKYGNGLMRNLVLNGNPLFKLIITVLFIPFYIVAWIVDYIINLIIHKTSTNPKRYVGMVLVVLYNILTSISTIVLTLAYFVRNYYSDYYSLKKIKQLGYGEKLTKCYIKKDIKDKNSFSLFNVAFNDNIKYEKKISVLEE